MVDLVQKLSCQILLSYFGKQQIHFQFFTWKKIDNYLTKVKCLLEGISSILNARGFKLHERVTSLRIRSIKEIVNLIIINSVNS
jgi:hypothetical protein